MAKGDLESRCGWKDGRGACEFRSANASKQSASVSHPIIECGPLEWFPPSGDPLWG
jgi:hypothetical protein